MLYDNLQVNTDGLAFINDYDSNEYGIKVLDTESNKLSDILFYSMPDKIANGDLFIGNGYKSGVGKSKKKVAALLDMHGKIIKISDTRIEQIDGLLVVQGSDKLEFVNAEGETAHSLDIKNCDISTFGMFMAIKNRDTKQEMFIAIKGTELDTIINYSDGLFIAYNGVYRHKIYFKDSNENNYALNLITNKIEISLSLEEEMGLSAC